MAKTRFLADLHDRFGLREAQVAAVVDEALDLGASQVARIARGYDNEVYRVTLVDDRIVYLRIRRPDEGTYEHEAWAMSLARDVGVRVPEVLAVEASSDPADGRPIMIIAAAAGRQLETTISRSDRFDSRLLVSLGEELARLHTISMPGIWRPDEQGRWPAPGALRSGFGAGRRREADLLLTAGLTAGEVDRIMALIDVSPDPPLSGFVLCHGDISPEHVFVDGDLRVSGLIDWGMWHAGSRLGELATMTTTFGWPALDTVLSGYGDVSGDGEVHRQIATVQAVQLIGHIAHHTRLGDADGAARTVAATRQALRILDGASASELRASDD